MCLGCQNIQEISSSITYKTDYSWDRIIKYGYKNYDPDYFLVPKGELLVNGIVIYYCPFCGRKLR